MHSSVRNAAEEGMTEAYELRLPVPWNREAAFTRLLLKDASINGSARFHKVDLWHSVHLGVGKSWIASSLLVLASRITEGTIDDKFRVFNEKYMAFCRKKKLDKLISKLDKHYCGPGGSAEAIGTWNKAALTSNLCMFLEDLCADFRELVQKHKVLKLIEPRCVYIYISVWLCIFKNDWTTYAVVLFFVYMRVSWTCSFSFAVKDMLFWYFIFIFVRISCIVQCNILYIYRSTCKIFGSLRCP